MPRVFAGLSLGSLMVMGGTAMLGFLGDSLGPTYHIALAIFSLLLSCLGQVLAFTYLTVTFKMMVQAIHIGQFSIDPLIQAKFLKRKMGRCLGAVFMGILLVTATGAMNWRNGSDDWLHLVTAISLFIMLIYVFVLEFTIIVRNVALAGEVMRQYANRAGGPPHGS